MKIKSIFLFLSLFLGVALFLQGCTFFGLFIGHSIDKKNKRLEVEVPIGEVYFLEKDTKIHLLMKDGFIHRGFFHSTESIQPAVLSPSDWIKTAFNPTKEQV